MALTALIRGGGAQRCFAKALLGKAWIGNGKVEFDWPCDGFANRCEAKEWQRKALI